MKCKSKTVKKRPEKQLHAVDEQDSDTYEDFKSITAIESGTETINQVKENHSKNQQLFAGTKIDK